MSNIPNPVIPAEKQCCKCGETKPISAFNLRTYRTGDGEPYKVPRNDCKECRDRVRRSAKGRCSTNRTELSVQSVAARFLALPRVS